ncbi:pentapeptide repeat-containing protein [Natronorubrum thiooxidans]|nr:pentapeptide repeat-containing protein [Natronorubrum thiooxidans]
MKSNAVWRFNTALSAIKVIFLELILSRSMGGLKQYNHNDSVSLLVKINEDLGAGGGRRVFKFKVCVGSSEEVNFIVWEGSPATDVDWEDGEWYQLENVLVKKWSSTTELSATKRTTAEKVQSETAESDVSGSEAVYVDSVTDRCGFTWIPDKQNNPESRPHCCYRNTWRGFDRCIWHAETDITKPPEALAEVREQPENRKLNASPRELLSGAVLRNAELTGSVLTAVDFSGADFQNANLTDVYLSYSNLSNADLRGVDLTDCTVSKISLKNSDLRTADLTGLSLFRTNFTDAELSDAIFTNTNVKDPIFTGANPEAAKGIIETEKTGQSGDNEIILPRQSHSSEEVSILHTTNTHLDRKNMGRQERQNDFVNSFKEIVDYACTSEVGALIHTGNLFWSQHPDKRIIKECKRLLHKLNDNQVEFILVRGERDATRTSKIIQELESEGLLTGPQTGWHTVSDIGIFSYGASSPPLSEINPTQPDDTTSHLVALSDAVSIATDSEDVTELEDTLELSLDAVLIGNRTESIRTSESGIQILSPGMPERIIGKRQIKTQPRTPVFFEYHVTAGAIDVTAHEIDARPVSGFQINLSSDATAEDVDSALLGKDLHDAAVIIEIIGTRDGNSISKNDIQQIISDRAAIVRVYDERTAVENQEKTHQNQIPSSSGWDVDSLAAATTLDATDIEDAVNRLMSSGCSHDTAIKYVRRYLTEMLRGEGLFAVYGVGPSSGQTLVEAGITTIEELQAAAPHELSARSDFSIQQIQRLQEAAEAGNLSSLDPDNKQVADQLLSTTQESPIKSNNDWNSSSREESAKTEENQSNLTSAESTTGPKGTAREAMSETSDDEQGILTPSELPVPSPETFTVPGGGTVFVNYLSEYYESFRSAKRVLELVFQIPRIDIDPDDRRDPRVQYYVLLDACIGFGDISTSFAGYGPQHQDRLPFSIRDYRKVFGDAETVTDYQVTNVEPFGDDTHDLLYEKASVKTTREFVRPCVPGTNYPLPELPGSFKELQEALNRLATFPAYPPLPTENGINTRTIPIAEIYQTCFEDLSREHQADLTSLTATESSPPTGPVPAATPTSTTEAESTLLDFGRLSHLFRRVAPPADSPASRSLNVFALDWYRSDSPSFEALKALAKHGENDPIDVFRPRLQDLLHRRFLLDTWDYDYITVFPGHEAGSLSPQLVELAQDAVLETDILYTPLLERTETVERQREKSKDERQRVAVEPSASLRARAKLNGDTVILFDDICTTGSSLLAGAHLLRQAGADRVACLTLGLTPGGPRENVKEITDPETPASEIIAGLKR